MQETTLWNPPEDGSSSATASFVGAMVMVAEPLVPGSAYWVYAKEEAELQLAGETDATVEPTLPASGKLHFGADPGAAYRSSGTIWKDGRFVEAEEENPSQGGWWKIK